MSVPGQLTQPAVPPGRQLEGEAVEQSQEDVALGPVVAGRLHPDEERDRLAVDVHALQGRDVGVGDQQEAPAVAGGGGAEDKVGSRAQQAAQQLVVAVAGPLEHLHPAVNHDDDAIAHAGSTPGQQAATATGPRSGTRQR